MKYRQFLRFPGFLNKALTLSYDDGAQFDKRLVEILDQYGVKCTFNLNSGKFGDEKDPNRWNLSESDVQKLYKNSPHEVAIHGEKHLSFAAIPTDLAVNEVITDRKRLEALLGRVVKGAAYPHGNYDAESVEILKRCGIEYARTVDSTHDFELPTEFLAWNPTCHHDDKKLSELVTRFLESNQEGSYYWCIRPRVFYLWGHSFEFNNHNNWEVMENFCKQIGNRGDIWYATNGEICEYVTAYDRLRFSADGSFVQNPSARDVYLDWFGKQILCKGGETVQLH